MPEGSQQKSSPKNPVPLASSLKLSWVSKVTILPGFNFVIQRLPTQFSGSSTYVTINDGTPINIQGSDPISNLDLAPFPSSPTGALTIKNIGISEWHWSMAVKLIPIAQAALTLVFARSWSCLPDELKLLVIEPTVVHREAVHVATEGTHRYRKQPISYANSRATFEEAVMPCAWCTPAMAAFATQAYYEVNTFLVHGFAMPQDNGGAQGVMMPLASARAQIRTLHFSGAFDVKNWDLLERLARDVYGFAKLTRVEIDAPCGEGTMFRRTLRMDLSESERAVVDEKLVTWARTQQGGVDFEGLLP
ncbi:hypothetical protein BU23DRAFT_570026 [Bimuria novae-zelandiae CBS 107.79]|uniref:Uncharacterized protein n=1 Tax=Bimuria novae-zelandiae CBS 107.79 TaxID=1447943 RepID=A0A6A5V1D2_9PLEO|nr:hypothetical protein BU23DRAFT_570026 [Bimuria novae-zelandiae CBS 107.79]